MDLSEQSERMQSFYGLKHDPFGVLVDTMVFSGTGGRYETAETIRHLLTYSHQDSLLIAPAGTGKRTLALQVLKLIEEHWRVAWIDGSEIESVSDLLQELIGQFGLGLKLDASDEELISKITDIVSSRYDDDESFLIVVQFAERLPAEILNALKLVRQSTESIDQRIRQLWLSTSYADIDTETNEDDWYVHSLNPLSDDDAEQYLKDRLVASGFIDNLPFAEKDIARLNHLSEGIPSKLNDAARDYMISSTFQSAEKKQSFPLTHVFAGLAALSLVIIAILYQTSEQKSESSALTSAEVAQPMTAVEKRLAEAVAKVEAKQNEAESPGEPVAADAISIAAEQETAQPDAIDVSENLTVDVVEAAADVISEVETTSPAAQSQKADAFSLINRASSENFTLQLVGVREREKLAEVLPLFEPDSPAEIVVTQHQGKDWFVLIYGEFETKALAKVGFEAVPKELGISEPWIRSFKSLRDSM